MWCPSLALSLSAAFTATRFIGHHPDWRENVQSVNILGDAVRVVMWTPNVVASRHLRLLIGLAFSVLLVVVAKSEV